MCRTTIQDTLQRLLFEPKVIFTVEKIQTIYVTLDFFSTFLWKHSSVQIVLQICKRIILICNMVNIYRTAICMNICMNSNMHAHMYEKSNLLAFCESTAK